MMWVTFNSILRRFVVIGWCIHHIRPKTIMALLTRWDRKSKDVAHPLRANKKFVIPNLSHHFVPMHPSHFWFWSGSDYIDMKSALRQICCPKLCLDFLWGLINFIHVVGSPSCISHVIVLDGTRNNPLEYMGVQILDSLSVRMRKQPENVDHLRCSPTKTWR